MSQKKQGGKGAKKYNRNRNSEKNKRYVREMRREKNKERRLKRHVAKFPADGVAKKSLDSIWERYWKKAI